MSTRPAMTWHHGGMALLAVIAFAVIGLVVSMAVVLMFDVGWMITYLFWPFLVLQLVVSLVFQGGYELIQRLARKTPPAEEQTQIGPNQVPWLREKSGWIGLFLGVSYTALMELNTLWT